jgi:hypothetical protein
MTYTETLFQELAAEGRIVATGDLRPGRDGKLRPVYVMREFVTFLPDGKRADRATDAESRRRRSTVPRSRSPRSRPLARAHHWLATGVSRRRGRARGTSA